jgi:hypothetical protein
MIFVIKAVLYLHIYTLIVSSYSDTLVLFLVFVQMMRTHDDSVVVVLVDLAMLLVFP